MNDGHEAEARRPHLIKKDGRIWFTREAERRVYFVLTVIVLAIGVLYKLGVI